MHACFVSKALNRPPPSHPSLSPPNVYKLAAIALAQELFIIADPYAPPTVGPIAASPRPAGTVATASKPATSTGPAPSTPSPALSRLLSAGKGAPPSAAKAPAASLGRGGGAGGSEPAWSRWLTQLLSPCRGSGAGSGASDPTPSWHSVLASPWCAYGRPSLCLTLTAFMAVLTVALLAGLLGAAAADSRNRIVNLEDKLAKLAKVVVAVQAAVNGTATH